MIPRRYVVINRGPKPALEPLPCSDKHAQMRAKCSAASVLRLAKAPQPIITPDVQARMDRVVWELTKSGPMPLRELQYAVGDPMVRVKWACKCLRNQGRIRLSGWRWSVVNND